jgi:hypothetical protein
MTFPWLEMRINEERDRREREAEIMARLPRAVEEIFAIVEDCVKLYCEHFGEEAARATLQNGTIHVTVRAESAGRWTERGAIEITMMPELPGIEVNRDGERTQIQIGILPGDRVFYKLGEDYLTIEELTQKILDRTLFPKLVA